MLAGMSGNNRCHWRSLLVAGAVFGELGRCFESLETLVLRDCLYLWCRAWWSFCAARAVLLMPQAPFSQQVQYFRDLEDKVPDSRVKHGFCTCSICVIRSIDFFCGACIAWLKCLSLWLCARRIALDMAWCSFWSRSRILLGALAQCSNDLPSLTESYLLTPKGILYQDPVSFKDPCRLDPVRFYSLAASLAPPSKLLSSSWLSDHLAHAVAVAVVPSFV